MIEALVASMEYPLATAGDIAVINLESARKFRPRALHVVLVL